MYIRAFRNWLLFLGLATVALIQFSDAKEAQIKLCDDNNKCLLRDGEIPESEFIEALGCHTITSWDDGIYGKDHGKFLIIKNDEKLPICCALFEAKLCKIQGEMTIRGKGGDAGYRWEWFTKGGHDWRQKWPFQSYACIKGEWCEGY